MTDAEQKYRQDLIADQLKLSIELDKKIAWISAGAIGLSITFMKDVVNADEINSKWALITCWSIMGAVLFLALFNNLIGTLSYGDMLRKFDKSIQNDTLTEQPKWRNTIIVFNWINVFLIGGSIVFLLIFSANNF